MDKPDTPSRSPKMARWLLRLFCSERVMEFLQGDLEELYYLRLERYGATRAKLWYFIDVLSSIRPFAFKKLRSNSNLAMFQNYYITSVRNFAKQKRYFLINLLGLTTGLASFILVALYVINEFSYDRFHMNYENIYRVSNVATINGKQNLEAHVGAPLANILVNNYPEVEKAIRLVKSEPTLLIENDRKFIEEGILFADSSFFSFFSYPLLQGNPVSALANPRSVVLTASSARKLFPGMDPMGKQVKFDDDSSFYIVTGVAADAPENSHIQFDMLVSLSSKPDLHHGTRWIGYYTYTYVTLNEQANLLDLAEKMRDIFYQYMAPEIEYFTGQSIGKWEAAGNYVGFDLLPLADIHLYSEFSKEMEPVGNISYIYLYAITGLIILCIAIFNYVNMATAQSTSRAREVGIRKVMGSTWSNLIQQFVFESVLLSVLAGIIAIGVVHVLLPNFEMILQKELAYGIFTSALGPALVLVLAIVVGLLAGGYPAFVLSRYQPVHAIKGITPSSSSGWLLRNVLVVIQFTASIVIIITTVVVYSQVEYMLSKNLGFDKEQIMVIRKPGALGDNLPIFKDELEASASISNVVLSKTLPGKGYDIRSYRPANESETFLFQNNLVAFDYEKVMELQLAEGRFFSRDHPTDNLAVVINEAAAHALGFEDPVGMKLTSPWHMGELMTIIGVMKDYHSESLHKPITPLTLELMPDNSANFITMKLAGTEDVRNTVNMVMDKWTSYSSDHPLQYFFYDQEYETLYRTEVATGQLFVVLATLSIVIACLGMIGLVAYQISVRNKEIGIRKVLGAGTPALVWLLSNSMVRTTLVATLLSWPIAYFATNYWLENFAERSVPNPMIYLNATLGVLVLGALTISFQTVKASLRNPVETLRQE